MFSNDTRTIFQKLAKSRPEFNCVGRLIYTVELYGNNRVTVQQESSGVYVGNKIVFTAAHCVPDDINNGELVKNSEKHWFFQCENNDDETTCRVLMAMRHPQYCKNNNCAAKNDIAVLLLDKDPNNILIPEIDYTPFTIKYDCIAVGYSDTVMPLSKNEKREPLSFSTESLAPKVAVKIPDCHSCESIVLNILGFNSNEFKINKDFDQATCTQVKRKYNLEEAGISYGMSGGAWFSKSGWFLCRYKLYAISFHIWHKASNPAFRDREYCNNLSGDGQSAVALFPYKEWLAITAVVLNKKILGLEREIIELENKCDKKVKKNQNYFQFVMKDKKLLSHPSAAVSHSGNVQRVIRNAVLLAGFFSVALGIGMLALKQKGGVQSIFPKRWR